MTETYLITLARYVRTDREPELEELSNLFEQWLMGQGCQIIGAGDAGVPEVLAENHTALCRLTFRDANQ